MDDALVYIYRLFAKIVYQSCIIFYRRCSVVSQNHQVGKRAFPFPQKSYGKSLDPHFQQLYANTVLELDRLNRELNEYLIGVQQHHAEVSGATWRRP